MKTAPQETWANLACDTPSSACDAHAFEGIRNSPNQNRKLRAKESGVRRVEARHVRSYA